MRCVVGTVAISVLLLAISCTTTAGAITIKVKDNQFLIVNGKSLKQVEAYVDCDNLKVYWNSYSFDLRPRPSGEPIFPSLPDQDYSEVPFLTNGIAGNTFELCVEKERDFYARIVDACISSVDETDLQPKLEIIKTDKDFPLILRYLWIAPYDAVCFRYFSQSDFVCISPVSLRYNKNLVYPDPCGIWERKIKSMAQIFADSDDDRVIVLLVQGEAYDLNGFRSIEELRAWIARSPAPDRYSAILEELR